jgi:hypothetical protein
MGLRLECIKIDEQLLLLKNPLSKILLLEDKRSDWVNPIFDERSVASFILCSQCFCTAHPTVVSIHILKKSTSQCQPFFNSKDDLKMQTRQWCVQYETTRHTGIHGRKKQNDLVSTISWQNMSVHVSAARHDWDHFHLFKCICFFCRCCQCSPV